jgi:uncharacterized membrane protein
MPRPRESDSPRFAEEAQQLYERAIRRLRICIRVLSALLAASIARVVVDGLTVAGAFALAFTAVLLVASLGLWRQGSRLK